MGRGFTANQRRADINNRSDITMRVKDFVKMLVNLGFVNTNIAEADLPVHLNSFLK